MTITDDQKEGHQLLRKIIERHHQLPHRVTPTLVTPLAMAGKTVSLRCVGDRFCHGATGYHTSRRQGRV